MSITEKKKGRRKYNEREKMSKREEGKKQHYVIKLVSKTHIEY